MRRTLCNSSQSSQNKELELQAPLAIQHTLCTPAGQPAHHRPGAPRSTPPHLAASHLASRLGTPLPRSRPSPGLGATLRESGKGCAGAGGGASGRKPSPLTAEVPAATAGAVPVRGQCLFTLFTDPVAALPQLRLQDGEVFCQFHVQEGLPSRLQIQYQESE